MATGRCRPGLRLAHHRYPDEVHSPPALRSAGAVEARISEYENRLRIDYEFFDAASGARTSKGYTIQVAVAMPSGEMRLVSPPILLQKLGIPS